MYSIYKRELSAFFSSLIAYMVLGIFLLVLGLFMWVFKDTGVMNYNYASLDQLFTIAPMVFIFLIPAITMRSLAEERQNGTIELIATKPITDRKIILAKFFACYSLVVLALLPTVIYVYSIYMMGSPRGNIDMGATMGSYAGLLLLSAVFVSIGVFSSSLSANQIVSFVMGSFLCFIFYWFFYYFSRLPIFVGKWDNIIEKMGISFHYESMSRGVLDSRDIVYFVSVVVLFIAATVVSLKINKR